MKSSDAPQHTSPETSIKAVLDWLALSSKQHLPEHAELLHRQMRLVRATPIPTPQRSKLLDLFYTHTERLVRTEIPELQQASLPVSRRLRQRVRALQELLETLSQDYLNTLSELFDPQAIQPHTVPADTLGKTLQCIVWNIHVSHLVASPTPIGLWLALHNTFNTARRLGLNTISPEGNGNSLEQLYLGALLAAIAQPASFNSRELAFIAECTESMACAVHISETPPLDSTGVFWIDPNADFPACAIVRRSPPPDITTWFFSCKNLAQDLKTRYEALLNGAQAATLALPAMADSSAGQGVLRRLGTLWGNPGKRRFSRRRQSYRAKMCIGLEQLWHLLQKPEEARSVSEWMVINESPDGYAIMHVSGQTGHLEVGDVLAILPSQENGEDTSLWLVCIVRWAISENPEHLELGLQLLASRAMAAVIAQPQAPSSAPITALMIPETPPLRQATGLVVASGQLSCHSGKLIVLVEKDNLAIHELRPTHLDEQTNSIDIFSVEPDETM